MQKWMMERDEKGDLSQSGGEGEPGPPEPKLNRRKTKDATLTFNSRQSRQKTVV
jgi:hypothetical protein